MARPVRGSPRLVRGHGRSISLRTKLASQNAFPYIEREDIADRSSYMSMVDPGSYARRNPVKSRSCELVCRTEPKWQGMYEERKAN
jgi:hypothetical protein